MMRKLLVSLSILLFSAQLLAIEVLWPGYEVEILATYPGTQVQSMAFDNNGNIYATHVYDKCIWKITPDGTASKFVSGLDIRGIVFGGGTTFGDYLYTPDGLDFNSKIRRIALDGSVSVFANFDPPKHNASPLAIDTTGLYGGNMFTATSGQDRTYMVNPTGSVSLFADFPGWRDGGGPSDIVFDKTGNFGNSMIMATCFTNLRGNEYMSGLWRLSPRGQSTRLIPEMMYPAFMDIDDFGDFGGKLYVTAKQSAEGPILQIWAVEPDGSHFVFATTDAQFRDIIFGDDGAMYVSEFLDGQTVLYKVSGANKNLVELYVVGPDAVVEDSQQQYKAMAVYDDGFTKDVTGKVEWFCDETDFAGIGLDGMFCCDKALYLNQNCTIFAELTDGNGEVFIAEKSIRIIPLCPTGSALEFDGVDDYVNCGNPVELNPDFISTSAWVKTKDSTGSMSIISKDKSSWPQQRVWQFTLSNGKPYFVVFQYENNHGGNAEFADLISTNFVADGKWHYLSATWDGTVMKIFVDGQPDASKNYTGSLQKGQINNVFIGKAETSNPSFFKGQIDEVSIFNRCLTVEEVQNNMYHKLRGDEEGLVGYWDFDSAGNIAYDKSVFGNHGVLGGTENVQLTDPNWVTPGAPVMCTRPALAKRNIAMAKDIKKIVLDELNFALKAEIAAGQMLAEEQKVKNSPFMPVDIVKSRIQIYLAIANEKVALNKIIESVKYLNNAFECLNETPAEVTSNGKSKK